MHCYSHAVQYDTYSPQCFLTGVVISASKTSEALLLLSNKNKHFVHIYHIKVLYTNYLLVVVIKSA